jgi:uncharacterized protein
LSVSDESPPTTVTATSAVADPGPLGLAGFALTTFLLSAANARWMSHSTTNAFLGYAFAYGGLAQLLAGMWEFRRNNTFGATAFSTWGAFWIGLYFYVKDAIPATATAGQVNKDIAWILVAFAVVNAYFLLFSTQINLAVFTVFLTLEATLIVDAIAKFHLGNALYSGILITGGYIGIITAAAAWYTSMAGIATAMDGKLKFPVGKPLIS